MFRRDTGSLDEDLFKGAKSARLGNLDYGVRGREMLIDVSVSDGLGEQLTVVVKQGKLNVTQTWKVSVGSTVGFAVAHHPVMVSPTFCGEPMTITAKLGGATETRTIAFTCSD